MGAFVIVESEKKAGASSAETRVGPRVCERRGGDGIRGSEKEEEDETGRRGTKKSAKLRHQVAPSPVVCTAGTCIPHAIVTSSSQSLT